MQMIEDAEGDVLSVLASEQVESTDSMDGIDSQG
jgi:hypothetical protein